MQSRCQVIDYSQRHHKQTKWQLNYILSKTVIYDISPKTNIIPSSTVKREKKKSPAVATLELKTLFPTEFHVYSLVLCFRA